MKIIVTGGRNYSNKEMVWIVLDSLKPTEIIHGGASGADQLASRYAIERKINQKTYRADWDRYGKSAGPIRNQLMISENKDADLVVAFPGGLGTSGCIRIARSVALPVLEIAR